MTRNEVAIIVNNEKGYCFIPVPNKETAEQIAKIFSDSANVKFNKKIVESGKVALDDLPKDVQEEVRDTLRAFNECFVTYENGRFTAMAAVGIKANYGIDHFVCNRYTK